MQGNNNEGEGPIGMRKNIVIVGGGGHAKTVIDAIICSRRFAICGIVDLKLRKGECVLGIKVIGGDEKLKEVFRDGVRDAFLGIGSIGNCDLRKKIYENLKKIGFRLPIIIHPSAVVARDVKLGEGTFVAAGAVINSGTQIGRNVIINTLSSVDHDCLIGDFVHVAPGVTLSGGVEIGREAHVGTGACVTQYLKIGKKAFIKAGEMVFRDVADGDFFYEGKKTNAREKK